MSGASTSGASTSGAGTEPASKEEEETLVIKVIPLGLGPDKLYRMKPDTPFENVINFHPGCACGLKPELRLFFNSRQIKPDDTPSELGMKDGDEIFLSLSHRASRPSCCA